VGSYLGRQDACSRNDAAKNHLLVSQESYGPFSLTIRLQAGNFLKSTKVLHALNFKIFHIS
jgi:hypothetical protein